MSKVYIIQAADDSWSSELEIVAATLDKEKAKSILRKINAWSSKDIIFLSNSIF